MNVRGGEVGFLRLDETAYRAASFLDERILLGGPAEEWLGADDIDRIAPADDPRLNFIFHLGHVGSTLLSRVLGGSGSIFSVREPMILRRLAGFEVQLGMSFNPWPMANFTARVDTVLKLLARVYRSPQVSLVKATSYVGEMGSLLMSRAPRGRAILLIVSPQTYIATILGGPASRAELRVVSPGRLGRLRRRWPSEKLETERFSEGELAAIGWTCELLGLADVANRFPERSLWVDFDRFLAAPLEELEVILKHLNGGTSEAELRMLRESPDFGRYSKATEHLFDGAVRTTILTEASITHAVEIERGLAWINTMAGRHGSIVQAARAAASESRR